MARQVGFSPMSLAVCFSVYCFLYGVQLSLKLLLDSHAGLLYSPDFCSFICAAINTIITRSLIKVTFDAFQLQRNFLNCNIISLNILSSST